MVLFLRSASYVELCFTFHDFTVFLSDYSEQTGRIAINVYSNLKKVSLLATKSRETSKYNYNTNKNLHIS